MGRAAIDQSEDRSALHAPVGSFATGLTNGKFGHGPLCRRKRKTAFHADAAIGERAR
jgi:hypothetical protein